MQALPQDQRYSATMRQGRYALQLTPTLDYQVDVPDLWTVVSGTFLNDPSPQLSIFFVAPAPATSTGLPRHPCRDHTTRVVGPTVSDLAGALRRQPVLDVTKPVPVTLDGYRGLYLEVTIPAEVDAGSCVDDRVSLFESGGPDGYAWQEGYVGRWWILDVDGERMVVMPQCDTGCTEDDFATLTAMAESITFRHEPRPVEPIYSITHSPPAGEVRKLPHRGGKAWSTLQEGRYALWLDPATPSRHDVPWWYEVDVPDLWTVIGGRSLSDRHIEGTEFSVVHTAADATKLPASPCRDHTTRVVGPTVHDLAGELRAHPVLEVTKPVPVTLDGNRGLYLEVTMIPDKIDARGCVDDIVSFFESSDSYAWPDGYVGRWWILDVDGERIVVMTDCENGCTEDDLDTLTQMAESISFTRGD